MDARLELSDSLFAVHKENSVIITNESGQTFLNIKLAIASSAPNQATNEIEKIKESENYRNVNYNKNYLPKDYKGEIGLHKTDIFNKDGSSTLKLSVLMGPKVPHTGGNKKKDQ